MIENINNSILSYKNYSSNNTDFTKKYSSGITTGSCISLNQDKFEREIAENSSFAKAKSNGLKVLFDTIPTFRRLDRVPDKIENSDYIPAYGLISLAVLNLPEDYRDAESAFKQIKSKFTKENFNPLYDYKSAQHPFSFFRGTFLNDFVDCEKTPFPRLSKWLLSHDTTLWDSGLGKKISNIFNIKTETIETEIKNLEKNPMKVLATKFNPKTGVGAFDWLGEITARALHRTTKIGAMLLATFEGAHFVNEMRKGKGIVSELAQSAITYTGSIASIGLGGAIGFKYLGSLGSVVGMGVGSFVGNKISKHFDT